MPLATNRVFKILYRLHIYVGLFVALHFFLLAATGTLLLFRHGWAPKESTAAVVAPAAYAAALEHAQKNFPADRPLSLFPDENSPGLMQLRLGEEGTKKFRGARKLTYDGQSGLPAEPKPESGFFATLLLIHRDLYLGSWGKLYVGFAGLLIAFTLVTGLATYGRFMRGRSYGEIRRSTKGLFFADLHKFLGATIFAWAILVSLTGCFLAFNSVLIKFYQGRELAALSARYAGEAPASTIAPVERVIQSALNAKPGMKFSFLAFPDTEFSLPNHYLVLVNGASPLEEKVSELLVIDARTGAFVEARILPWYLKLVMLSEPLHFGDYGGSALKAIWLLFSLLSGILGLSGPMAYLWKRRAQIRNSRINNLNLYFRGEGYKIPILGGVTCLAGLFGSLWGGSSLDAIAWAAAGLPLAAALNLLFTRWREGKMANSRWLAGFHAFLFGGSQLTLVALYPYLAERTGISLANLVACFSLGSFLFLWGNPFWSARSDTSGRTKILAVGAAGLALSLALLLAAAFWAPSASVAAGFLLLSRVTYGALASAVVPVAQALQADSHPSPEKAMLNHSLALSLGRLAGPALLLLASDFIPILLGAFLAAALGAVTWSLVADAKERLPLATESNPGASASKTFRWVLGIGFLFACFTETLNSTLAAFLGQAFSLNGREASQLMAQILLATGALVVGTQATARIIPTAWQKSLLTGLLALAGGASLLSAGHPITLWPAVVLLALGIGLVPPAYLASLGRGRRGRAAGWVANAHTLGYGCGGLLASCVLRTGHSSLSWVLLALLLCLTAAPKITGLPAPKEVAC